MKALKHVSIMLLACFALLACGGGGSIERNDTSVPTVPQPTAPDPDTPATPTLTYSVTLSITDTNGGAANQLGETSPLVVTAQVLDQDGNPGVDKLVTFGFSVQGIASFDNDTGTGLTDAQGLTQIGLLVGELSGDGLVTAVSENSEQASVGFRSLGIQQQQSTPAFLRLFTSSAQIASSGSDEVELIAEVKNAQNILLAGVDVSFSADNGASLEIVNSVTREDGTARALLRTTNNQQNRQIVASVVSGVLSDSVDVSVVGTEVNISGASSVIVNDSAPYTIQLADSNGQGIANQVVNVTASTGVIDNPSPITGPTGQVSVNYTSSQSGPVQISASSLSATNTIDVAVQEDDFSFSQLPNESIPVGVDSSDEGAQLTIRWFKDGVPFANGNVLITTSRGVLTQSESQTDAQGLASFTIKSESAGPASISAIGTDSTGEQVTSRATVEFIATSVNSIFVDASPDLIGPESQESNITAILRDERGNLVKGKRVDFTLLDSSGGRIEPNSAITDSNGIASITYYSNAVSVEDGVTIQAEADGISAQTQITVGDRAFDISIGTGNIIELPDNATYLKEFAVFVSDSVGRPVEDIQLTVSSTPVKFSNGGFYLKGFWELDTVDNRWFSTITAVCANEDVDANGSLEPSEDLNGNGALDEGEDRNGNGLLDLGEDTNGDGELTPGIIGTIGFRDGIARTNAAGQATIELRYPREFGAWAQVQISVFGQSTGSEAIGSQVFSLGVAGVDLSDPNNPPPANPFGFSSSCSNAN